MKELHKTSFRESLAIQKRVIGALLMREIITRYGRTNIGFLWLFVEPLLMTLVIVLMWKFFKANEVSSLNIVAFIMTGYPMMMMWRNASNRAIGSINANASLLYHRNVRVLDTIFARMLLEISGATIAQIAITAIFIVIGWINPPADIFYMLLAWLLMAMFAVGLGLVICSISFHLEPCQNMEHAQLRHDAPLRRVFLRSQSAPADTALCADDSHGSRHGNVPRGLFRQQPNHPP